MPNVFNTPEKRLELLAQVTELAAAEMTSDLEEEIRVLNQFMTDITDMLSPEQVTMILSKIKEYIVEDESELFAGSPEKLRATVLENLTIAIDEPIEDVIAIVSNLERANIAGEAVGLLATKTGISGEDSETQVSDLLANLMHYCDVNDVDFQSALARGADNYQSELEGEQ